MNPPRLRRPLSAAARKASQASVLAIAPPAEPPQAPPRDGSRRSTASNPVPAAGGADEAAAPVPLRRPAAQELDEGALGGVLGYHISKASVTTLGMFARHAGHPLDLRPVEFSLLLILLANTQVTPKQLARALALSAPNLTILLDRMQDRGLLERVRSEADRRSQHVLLTPPGRALAQRCVEVCTTMEQELDDCLSPGEHLLLIELLQKVVRHGRAD